MLALSSLALGAQPGPQPGHRSQGCLKGPLSPAGFMGGSDEAPAHKHPAAQACL